ncbi:hypothetical protein K491DRAFT_760230 [Lophiostoma macrostomum CBS 122681]|uniref:Uncharacterized protein n=1 Tax=Lophiostoma macrostomum CBS 122681 TaxID=1314788 RepID=A0A6A6T185_9PLEO|nr:hypothetical protein K491DRAFT_760230 [Lophiostoma macrostomum CBS 122681]
MDKLCFAVLGGKKHKKTYVTESRVVHKDRREKEAIRVHSNHNHRLSNFYSGGHYFSHSRSNLPRHVDGQSSSYYYGGVGGAVMPHPSYSYVLPSSTAVVTTAAAQTQSQNTPPIQYTYVTAAATPTTLPTAYYTSTRDTTTATPIRTDTAARTATGILHGRPATREELNREARRIATESGAYRPRRIKPADAHPDDQFWCRERDGEWHLRKYYVIENECQPGRWQMDAEVGFLVFHRD